MLQGEGTSLFSFLRYKLPIGRIQLAGQWAPQEVQEQLQY